MKNYVQKGDTLALPAPDGVKSGDIVIAGGLKGIAVNDAEKGEEVVISVRGVYDLAKDETAAEIGGTAYVFPGSDKISSQQGEGAVPLGLFVAGASENDEEGRIKLVL